MIRCKVSYRTSQYLAHGNFLRGLCLCLNGINHPIIAQYDTETRAIGSRFKLDTKQFSEF